MGKGRKKKGRNRNREGGISKRPDNRWAGYITIHTPTGPRRVSTTKKTREEAEAWLYEIRHLARTGAYAYEPNAATVAEFVERWLEDEVRPAVAESSYDSYRRTFRLHIQESIGAEKLSGLTTAKVQAWKAESVRASSANTAAKAFTLLKRALSQAVEWRVISDNPASRVKKPKHKPKESKWIRTRDVWTYLDAVAGDPYESLFTVMAFAGPRPVELLELRWRDWQEQTLRIGRSKTDAGRRDVPLPDTAEEALRTHRRQYAERLLLEGISTDINEAYIWPVMSRSFEPMTPYKRRALLERWRAALGRAGLPYVPMYSLRHTANMLFAAAGMSIKDAATVLGHTDTATTLKHYSHYEEERAREAMRGVDELLRREG